MSIGIDLKNTELVTEVEKPSTLMKSLHHFEFSWEIRINYRCTEIAWYKVNWLCILSRQNTLFSEVLGSLLTKHLLTESETIYSFTPYQFPSLESEHSQLSILPKYRS